MNSWDFSVSREVLKVSGNPRSRTPPEDYVRQR
jgi:hypothetical protein